MVALVLGIGFQSLARAANVICTLTPASTGTPVAETCGQPLFLTSDFLNWGQPPSVIGYSGLGAATNPPSAGPLFATSFDGLGVTLSSSNMLLERADNTIDAWSNTFGWTSPSLVAGQTINTFGGHFGAPATPTDTPPFGDNLLGVVPSTAGGNSTLALAFSAGVSGAGFMVSSLSDQDFIAVLQAFDSSNNLLETYTVNTNGLHLGAGCAGLNQPAIGGNPIPCNDAPLIQVSDAQARISRVLLTVNDTQGAFIDQLALTETLAPEPSLGTIAGAGIFGFVLWAGRRRPLRLNPGRDSSLD